MEGQQSEPRRRTWEAVRSFRSQGTVHLKKGMIRDTYHTSSGPLRGELKEILSLAARGSMAGEFSKYRQRQKADGKS